MSRTGEKCIPSGSSPTGLAYLGCWRCQHSCAQSCEGPGTINNRWLASLKGGRVMSIFDLSTSSRSSKQNRRPGRGGNLP